MKYEITAEAADFTQAGAHLGGTAPLDSAKTYIAQNLGSRDLFVSEQPVAARNDQLNVYGPKEWFVIEEAPHFTMWTEKGRTAVSVLER